MKLLKTYLLVLGFISFGSIAQDIPVESLPVATINENYLVTVPEIPIQEYYFIDISHLTFASEEEATKLLEFYLTANVIRPIIHYSDNYVVLQVMVEYIDGDTDYNNLQFYLNHLTKPLE